MSSRRKYTKEFKLEAVRMANTSGVTLQQLGQELGINPNMLGKWRKQLQASDKWEVFPGKGHPRDEEMVALKRELARVRKERDFLKEAAAYFAKESR
jgi:transposase-like protein